MLPPPPEKIPIIQLAHPAANSRIDVPRSGNLRVSLLQNRPRRLDQCRIDLDQDDRFEPDLIFWVCDWIRIWVDLERSAQGVTHCDYQWQPRS
jgi:hypothetical protein